MDQKNLDYITKICKGLNTTTILACASILKTQFVHYKILVHWPYSTGNIREIHEILRGTW